METPKSSYRARLSAGIPVSDRQLQVAGLTTALLEGGDGPPMVLLHGPGEFAATWIRVIPDLLETHRVVAPDLPGHGATAVPDGSMDADYVLEWLADLIEQTCPSPPVIAGHLLGGAIACRFAAKYPERISRLVLVDSFGLAPYRPSPRFALALVGFIARPTERSQDRLFRRCFVDLDDLRAEAGERWEALEGYALERAQAPELQVALKSLMPAFAMRAIPREDLERIAVPVSLIWGRHDLQVRLRVAESASARYGWPLYVVEGAADDPAVEEPEAFLRALRIALGSEAETAEFIVGDSAR